MIKTELEYNPYLLETNILFNGKSPKINSLVEKYKDGLLQSWIHLIPSIFRDEMNGYGFELVFSGTELDFKELSKAFTSLNIDDDKVHLVHKRVMKSREQKVKEIDGLLEWLEDNQNHRFDLSKFRIDNNEVFTRNYPYVVLHANVENSDNLKGKKVSVECVDDIKELKNTNLHNVPILMVINLSNVNDISSELNILFNSKGINEEQLFFFIDDCLNRDSVIRVLKDLGIVKPKVLHNIDDEELLRYIEVYPVSEYIGETLTILRNKANELNEVLEDEQKECLNSNRFIHTKINEIENEIELLEASLNKFNCTGNMFFIEEYKFIEQYFIDCIYRWKNRKTKTKSSSEAIKESATFNNYCKICLSEAIDKTEGLEGELKTELLKIYTEWYKEGKQNLNFSPKVNSLQFRGTDYYPDITLQLQAKYHEEYIEKNKLPFGLFGDGQLNDGEKVLETTWLFDEWRQIGVSEFFPILRMIIEESAKRVDDYNMELLNGFMEHLDSLIDIKEEQKDAETQKLSDAERQLQNDVDWLDEFADKINKLGTE